MAFFRINKEEKFTQIDNRMINDKTISAKAKGILIYLLSKPSDWKVYEVDIVNNMKDGRDSVRSGISELIENGYIERELASGEKGKFAGYNYNVYEHNSENPCWKTRVGKPDVGKPDNGKPDVGKPDTSNTKVTNTDLTNTNINNTNHHQEEPTMTTTENSFSFYENNIGQISGFIAEQIDHMINESTEPLVLAAMKLTVLNGAKNIKYTQTVLNNWAKDNITTLEQLESANNRKENRHGINSKQSSDNTEQLRISAENERRRKLLQGESD